MCREFVDVVVIVVDNFDYISLYIFDIIDYYFCKDFVAVIIIVDNFDYISLHIFDTIDYYFGKDFIDGFDYTVVYICYIMKKYIYKELVNFVSFYFTDYF